MYKTKSKTKLLFSSIAIMRTEIQGENKQKHKVRSRED